MTSKWIIVVAQAGWVFVGRPRREGDIMVIEDAYNIRRWSLNTKDGLGGLARRGPTAENDILDSQPTTRINRFGIVEDMDCNDDAWAAWHKKQKQ